MARGHAARLFSTLGTSPRTECPKKMRTFIQKSTFCKLLPTLMTSTAEKLHSNVISTVTFYYKTVYFRPLHPLYAQKAESEPLFVVEPGCWKQLCHCARWEQRWRNHLRMRERPDPYAPFRGLGRKWAAGLFFLTWFPFMISPSLFRPRYQPLPDCCCRYIMEEYVT